jgi:hypothetical protein
MLPPKFLASSGLFLVLPQQLPASVTSFSCDFVVASSFYATQRPVARRISADFSASF